MRREMPGFGSIVKADYGLMLGVLAPSVGWVLFLAVLLLPGLVRKVGINPAQSSLFLAIAVGMSVVGLPLAWLRWRTLARIFREGRSLEGRITSVWLSGDRGRVEFSYQLDGKDHQSGLAIHRTAHSEALNEGDVVEILVDPDNPQRAILPQLFR